MWPTPAEAASQFYNSNLRSAVRLLTSIVEDRRARGSGRPPGEPQAEWRAVLVLAMAALEAGLVDVGLAVHHHRIVDRAGSGTQVAEELARARGRLVDSLPLSVPNSQKIENFMLSQFGVLPSQIRISPVAQFTTRSKPVALGGAGSGSRVPFSGDWKELAARLDAIQHFRNAIAHADSRRLTTIPQSASGLPENKRGSIWARQRDETWSLQMPHTVTAVRTTVSVFITVTGMLCSVASLPQGDSAGLRSPDTVVPFGGD